MKWHWQLLVAIFVLLGVWTLVPEPASKACLLGYYAHCTFTPISTIICWVIAGLCYQLGRKAARKTRIGRGATKKAKR